MEVCSAGRSSSLNRCVSSISSKLAVEEAVLVTPTGTVTESPDEPDNRFLECAEAAKADYLVTGNARRFPQTHKGTVIVTGRRFLNILAEWEKK